METLDVGKEAFEDLSPEAAEMIHNTVDFMNTEKVELCKVWSEQKIRKEWTETNVVSLITHKIDIHKKIW